MQIAVESLSNLERKLSISIPAEQINNRFNEKLLTFAKNIKLPGFRYGKVPLDIIKKKYYQQIYTDILENLIEETCKDALLKEKLIPISIPKIEILSSKFGEDFNYTATFEIYPKIDLNNLNKIILEKFSTIITENDIEDSLNDLRKKYVNWIENTDLGYVSNMGDQILVDLSTKLVVEQDGIENKINEEKGIKFVFGNDSMWPEFEQKLNNVFTKEERQFVLKVPESNSNQNIAGKMMSFTVKVHKIYNPVFPELNDQFITNNVKICNSIKSLKEYIRTNLEYKSLQIINELFKDAVSEKILENNLFDIPKSILEAEMEKRKEIWNKQFLNNPDKNNSIPDFPQIEFEKIVKKQIAFSLLLSEVIKENNISVEQKEILAKIDLLKKIYGIVDDKIFSDQTQKDKLKNILMEDKAIECLINLIKPIDNPISYKDLIKKN